jgi:hypothetical protein
MAFGLKKVPCMHLFSGLHSDSPPPQRRADKINFEGLSQIIEFACDVTKQMLAMPRQTYVSKFDSQPPSRHASRAAALRSASVPD